MNDLYHFIYAILSPVLFIAISLIGVRLSFYWWSFAFCWKRYRLHTPVTTMQLKRMSIPYLKIQITTRGSQGSTEVILRGIENVLELTNENPRFYRTKLSVEVITESEEQADIIKTMFIAATIKIDTLVMPKDYQTKNGTKLKARGLHYAVERRRAGWNKGDGRTFIVHYDEESVMTPDELRKLYAKLATTDKKILEGPIYYPLDYRQASPLCRAMEANRPIGCYECLHIMESGLPLHLHGSNLVIDEAIENEIGWDIGLLDGQAFISEDYVFGMNTFAKYGPEVFGWHGCVMLEQPPFSVKSAFKQRYRWIFGVLQGMAMARRLESYQSFPPLIKLHIIWGTRFRIATFALGAIVGLLSCLVMPLFMVHALHYIFTNSAPPLPGLMSVWLGIVSAMWLGSVVIGSWYNVTSAGLGRWTMVGEIVRTILVAPIASFIESSAVFWSVLHWSLGKRMVNWVPTPKSKAADRIVNAMEQA